MLKYLITPLFLLCAVFSASSQDYDAADTTFWEFGLIASPDYNIPMLSGSHDGISADEISGGAQSRIGYSFGVNFTRQVSKRLYIQSGLTYQNKSYRTRSLQDTVLDLYDQYLASYEYYRIVRYHSISIPVILRVRMFNAGKTSFNFGIGAAPEFLLNRNTIDVFSDHKERDAGNAERFYVVKALVNLNIHIPMSDHWTFSLEPYASYSILGLNDKTWNGIKRNYLTAGLGLQFSYSITDQALYDYYYLHIYKKPPRSTF